MRDQDVQPLTRPIDLSVFRDHLHHLCGSAALFFEDQRPAGRRPLEPRQPDLGLRHSLDPLSARAALALVLLQPLQVDLWQELGEFH